MDEQALKRLIRVEVERIMREVVNQNSIIGDTIKQRHIGEGVRYIRAGATAAKPTTPEKDGAVFYDTTVNKLYIGDGGAWLEEEFT